MLDLQRALRLPGEKRQAPIEGKQSIIASAAQAARDRVDDQFLVHGAEVDQLQFVRIADGAGWLGHVERRLAVGLEECGPSGCQKAFKAPCLVMNGVSGIVKQLALHAAKGDVALGQEFFFHLR